MIHAKQWHYSLQRLPVASFYTHSTRRNPRDSSNSNSTFRRQGALRFILHTEGKEIFYPVYKDLQGIPGNPVYKTFHRHSSSTRTFQSFMTFQTFQSFMTFQPPRHYYTFQHFQYVPAPSSTTLYVPVLSSTSSASSVSRDSTHSSISPIRMQILHTNWFPLETPSSTNWDIPQTYILQRKGDVAISVMRLTYSPE